MSIQLCCVGAALSKQQVDRGAYEARKMLRDL